MVCNFGISVVATLARAWFFVVHRLATAATRAEPRRFATRLRACVIPAQAGTQAIRDAPLRG